ncbi:hypothetical protein Q5762_01005 [Streptomyces sp. P9(2023)]|uniref:hypothetical protein n=1 Tax=Streptomyces sp. P9(2023) TaxID=3064394 RepID=UPI0028F3F69D|nr:hypothetical protein [Streptomyces sp. P9(2023)]MDT9686950.1 hypothetical protein [Streptomyces sp. P9(2023)]
MERAKVAVNPLRCGLTRLSDLGPEVAENVLRGTGRIRRTGRRVRHGPETALRAEWDRVELPAGWLDGLAKASAPPDGE